MSKYERTLEFGGRTVGVSSLDKVFFPDAGITKGDVVDYYGRIAETALPHYAGRALSMHRFPDGIDGDDFFQKDAPDYFPTWIRRASLPKEGGKVDYVVAEEPATLAYLANQGCLTPHLMLSRIDRPERPDRLIFDLDPSDDDFEKVRQGARDLGALLDDLGLSSFLMTTGSRGLHVVVSLERRHDFDEVRQFARDVATLLATRHRDRLTVEQRKNKRGTRVFLDYLRNAYGQTSVAPYALRARPGAPVAAPIEWDELDDGGLGPQSFTLKNVFRRLGARKDPWVGIGKAGQRLAKACAALDKMSEASD